MDEVVRNLETSKPILKPQSEWQERNLILEMRVNQMKNTIGGTEETKQKTFMDGEFDVLLHSDI